MAIPNFLGIGAAKAGTTWLAENLRKHPDIWIPPIKEIHYFDEIEASPGLEFPDLFDQRLRYTNTRFLRIAELLKRPDLMADGEMAKWYLKWLFQKRTDEWYFSLFDFPHNAKIAGEITPSYSTMAERTISAIRNMNPEMKIIFSIRNPIFRSWSQVATHFEWVRSIPIEAASEEDVVNFMRTDNVVSRNDYVGIVSKWRKFFGEDHFHMVFFEEITRDPHALMRNLCTFLGVSTFPDALADDLGKKINEGTYQDFPLKYKKLIAELTIDHIRNCAETFGGNCVSWLQEAEAILS